MRETIRLTSTAPGLAVAPFQDEIIAGKYLIPKVMLGTLGLPTLSLAFAETSQDQAIFVNIMNIHRDPAVWGEDVS